jgi:hypothetical protein
MCRDVEGRRRTEEYLRKTDNNFRMLAEFDPSKVVDARETCVKAVIARHGHISHYDYDWWNPKCAPLTPLADYVALKKRYTCGDSAFINGFCLNYHVGDGDCDDACFEMSGCESDGGDCAVSATCECDITWIGDGFCDLDCNSEICNYDLGDCNQCAPDCPRAWQGDGICDPECNVEACKNVKAVLAVLPTAAKHHSGHCHPY